MEDFLAIPRYSYCKWLPWKPLFAYSLNEFRRVNIFDSRPMDPNDHFGTHEEKSRVGGVVVAIVWLGVICFS